MQRLLDVRKIHLKERSVKQTDTFFTHVLQAECIIQKIVLCVGAL